MPIVGLRPFVAGALAAAVLSSPGVRAQVAAPVIQGPESVQEWFDAGQDFVQHSQDLVPLRRRATNVILFVGDGMGVSTVTAARILEGQLHGRPGEENRLAFETFPHLALSKTYSWDQQTSDSAPTMTAMVTGYKAREGMLAVDHTTARFEPDATVIAAQSLGTILEQAAAAGKATGIVTTARLTHATPAANYAHTAVRDWESDREIRSYETANGLPPGAVTVKDIARQLIELPAPVKQSLKVAMGGGRTYFYPETEREPERNATGRRMDGRPLYQEWLTTRGPEAAYVWNQQQFEAIDPHTTEFLLGLFENSHLQYEADRATDRVANRR